MKQFSISAFLLLALFVSSSFLLKAQSAMSTDRAHSATSPLQAQSDDLYAQGVALFNKRDYKKAIPFFAKADELDKEIWGLGDNRAYYSSLWLAVCYRETGDYVKAAEANDFWKSWPVDRNITGELDELDHQAFECYKSGDLAGAANYWKRCEKLASSLIGEEHPNYASYLNNQASCYARIGEDELARDYGERAFTVYSGALGVNDTYSAAALINVSTAYEHMGDYKKALEARMKVLDIFLAIPDIAERKLASTLHSVSFYNFTLGNYQAAAEYGEREMEICDRILDPLGRDYILGLKNLVLAHGFCDNYSRASELGMNYIALCRRGAEESANDYSWMAMQVANYNSNAGRFADALDINSELLSLRERLFGKESEAYATALGNMAHYHSGAGHFKEALEFGVETVALDETVFGSESKELARALNNLASFYADLAMYEEAIEAAKRGLDIRRKVFGEMHADYALSLNNLAHIYELLGNYEKAAATGGEILDIYEATIGKENVQYASALSNLASSLYHCGETEDAIAMAEEALALREKVVGRDHPDYAYSLSNLGAFYSEEEVYDKAIAYLREALDIREKTVGTSHPDYATALSNLAYCLFMTDDYEGSLAADKKCLEIREKALGRNNPDYILTLDNLAYDNMMTLDLEGWTAVVEECNELRVNLLRNTFGALTSAERSLFWANHSRWFEQSLPLFANIYPGSALVEHAMDGVLTAKGVLLGSDVEFGRLLSDSGDPRALADYNALQEKRRELTRLYSVPVDMRGADTGILEEEAAALERDLLKRSKAFGDYTRYMSVGWKDVQRNLKARDVAIEFVSFENLDGREQYVAYVLAPGMATPEMIDLFEADDLKAVESCDFYTSPKVASLVWQPLDRYLASAENIYFAPAGELYNIAIESLPHFSGSGMMADGHTFYRMSSTRQLALERERKGISDAMLYGGLAYDADGDALVADAKRYAASPAAGTASQVALRDFDNLRGGYNALPATGEEVENISGILAKARVGNTLFSGMDGTEASLKNLSGKGIDLLHIATHGFYWTEREARRIGSLGFLRTADVSAVAPEDKALSRSGLLLAGANHALSGKPLPAGVEDGILTAAEIASLDFSSLDLVVLSACQTGLGEIAGDGVFGLQRGFKKAGANSLLMSLWKVDDNATKLLMTDFYNCLAQGMPKTRALLGAQQYLRDYEERDEEGNTFHPYDHPDFWAAFILLDAN